MNHPENNPTTNEPIDINNPVNTDSLNGSDLDITDLVSECPRKDKTKQTPAELLHLHHVLVKPRERNDLNERANNFI